MRRQRIRCVAATYLGVGFVFFVLYTVGGGRGGARALASFPYNIQGRSLVVEPGGITLCRLSWGTKKSMLGSFNVLKDPLSEPRGSSFFQFTTKEHPEAKYEVGARQYQGVQGDPDAKRPSVLANERKIKNLGTRVYSGSVDTTRVEKNDVHQKKNRCGKDSISQRALSSISHYLPALLLCVGRNS